MYEHTPKDDQSLDRQFGDESNGIDDFYHLFIFQSSTEPNAFYIILQAKLLDMPKRSETIHLIHQEVTQLVGS